MENVIVHQWHTRVPFSPHHLQHLVFLDFSIHSHSNVWGNFSLWLWFSFPNNQWCWASFHVTIGHLDVFFGKVSEYFAHLLNQVACFCCCWVIGVLHAFRILTKLDIWFSNVFYHSVSCLFLLRIVSFAVQRQYKQQKLSKQQRLLLIHG